MYSSIAVIHFNLWITFFFMAVAKFLCHLDLHPQKCLMFLQSIQLFFTIHVLCISQSVTNLVLKCLCVPAMVVPKLKIPIIENNMHLNFNQIKVYLIAYICLGHHLELLLPCCLLILLHVSSVNLYHIYPPKEESFTKYY